MIRRVFRMWLTDVAGKHHRVHQVFPSKAAALRWAGTENVKRRRVHVKGVSIDVVYVVLTYEESDDWGIYSAVSVHRTHQGARREIAKLKKGGVAFDEPEMQIWELKS